MRAHANPAATGRAGGEAVGAISQLREPKNGFDGADSCCDTAAESHLPPNSRHMPSLLPPRTSSYVGNRG